MSFGATGLTNQTRPWNFDDADQVVQVANLIWDGTAWVRQTASSAGGGLTDTELRATPVPVSGSLTANLGTIADVATQTTLALIKAKTDNLDVLLSTRTKPADTQTVSGSVLVSSLPALVASTANIGDVDVLTLPSLVAGTAKVGGVYDVGGNLIDEVPTVRSISRDFVTASALGNTQIVAAQGAGIRIRVLSLFLIATLATSIKFQSDTSDISALFPVGVNGGMVVPYNPHGWFQTAANAALNINLSVGTSTGCQVVWCQAT